MYLVVIRDDHADTAEREGLEEEEVDGALTQRLLETRGGNDLFRGFPVREGEVVRFGLFIAQPLGEFALSLCCLCFAREAGVARGVGGLLVLGGRIP